MTDHLRTKIQILTEVQNGTLTPAAAEKLLSKQNALEINNIANLDLGRFSRCGIPEVVLAEGKETDHLIAIMNEYAAKTGRCIASRVTKEQAAEILQNISKNLHADYRETCGIFILSDGTKPKKSSGTVAIITAGTSDIRVAEEAKAIAEEMGAAVLTAYDVGVAGIHRLIPKLDELKNADVFVVCAGREGTLPSVVAGLVDKPVIGVPVSTGYGYMGKGEAALASMLQSCAVITVVNIDAGFTAGAFAAQTAALIGGKK